MRTLAPHRSGALRASMSSGVCVVLSLAFLATALVAEDSTDKPLGKSSVGMPTRIEELVLPGAELEARRIESRAVPVVLRVVATYPHGTAFRYDLEYYGLEAGRFDLRDYLQRKDGSSTDDLPEIPIEVTSLLPAGQILPADLEVRPAPRIGGYRTLLIGALVVWILGLASLLLVRRGARLRQQQATRHPLSLAERLKPLVAAALAEQLPPEGQAEIERLLLTYWRHRLSLEGLEPLAAVEALREHEQAGALLRQVEAWLHKPGGVGDVDLAAVLEPYRDLPDEPLAQSSADQDDRGQAAPIPGGGRS